MTNKMGRKPLLLTITLALSLLLMPSATGSQLASGGQIDPIQSTSTPPLTAGSRETPVIPTLNPALARVCSCESAGSATGVAHQFNADGTVVRGKVNRNDIGMCQINTQPENGHVVAAAKLGLDLYTEAGNIAYANWLYSKEGTTPWNWSKSCWAVSTSSPPLSTP